MPAMPLQHVAEPAMPPVPPEMPTDEMPTGELGEPLRVDIGDELHSRERHEIIVSRLEAIEDANTQTHTQVMILFDQMQNLLSSAQPGSSSLSSSKRASAWMAS